MSYYPANFFCPNVIWIHGRLDNSRKNSLLNERISEHYKPTAINIHKIVFLV